MQVLMESREKWDFFSNPVSKLITPIIVRQTLIPQILYHVKAQLKGEEKWQYIPSA